MSERLPAKDDASRAFMEALTASDDMHRKAMRRAADRANEVGKGANVDQDSSQAV